MFSAEGNNNEKVSILAYNFKYLKMCCSIFLSKATIIKAFNSQTLPTLQSWISNQREIPTFPHEYSCKKAYRNVHTHTDATHTHAYTYKWIHARMHPHTPTQIQTHVRTRIHTHSAIPIPTQKHRSWNGNLTFVLYSRQVHAPWDHLRLCHGHLLSPHSRHLILGLGGK